jgi:hypothetical protein
MLKKVVLRSFLGGSFLFVGVRVEVMMGGNFEIG